MEIKPFHESYTEHEYYDVSPTGMIGTHPQRGSKGGLTQAINDEEYLYEKPISSQNRKATFSSPDIVYYDVEPDNFEPGGEYVIDQMPHVQKHMQNNLRAPSTGQSRTPKTIKQDVYDEDGYTLARPGANDDTHVPERPKINDSPNQQVKSCNKKFWLIGIGVLVSSSFVGGVIGIPMFLLGNIHYHEN